MTQVTLLVKSEKLGKICLGCLDENKRWIRPIKPGIFAESDIIMDNGTVFDIFDVAEMKFSSPYPIKHHKENMSFMLGTKIAFVKKLSATEQVALLKEIANTRLLSKVDSKYDLYYEIEAVLGKSMVLVGPVDLFDIQSNCGNHPKIWITGKNGREFDVRCTDIKFCTFVKTKSADFEQSENSVISSKNIPELKDKRIYFVIGLTGDHLDENNTIVDGRYAPERTQMQPRYWPLIVSILTIPGY